MTTFISFHSNLSVHPCQKREKGHTNWWTDTHFYKMVTTTVAFVILRSWLIWFVVIYVTSSLSPSSHSNPNRTTTCACITTKPTNAYVRTNRRRTTNSSSSLHEMISPLFLHTWLQFHHAHKNFCHQEYKKIPGRRIIYSGEGYVFRKNPW